MAVPASIRHLLWLSVADLGLDGVADEVVRTMHGRVQKPPLGVPPSYVKRAIESHPQIQDPVDQVVFDEIIETLKGLSMNTQLFSNGIEEQVAREGISRDAFFESLHALKDQGLVDAEPMAGGMRWWIHGVPDLVWLDIERQSGIDTEPLERRLLAHLVNEGLGTVRDPGEFLGVHERTGIAILNLLQRRGLLKHHRLANGGVAVAWVSPVARRELRAASDER